MYYFNTLKYLFTYEIFEPFHLYSYMIIENFLFTFLSYISIQDLHTSNYILM